MFSVMRREENKKWVRIEMMGIIWHYRCARTLIPAIAEYTFFSRTRDIC